MTDKLYTPEEVAKIMEWAVTHHAFSIGGKWFYPSDPNRPKKVYTTAELIELYEKTKIPMFT